MKADCRQRSRWTAVAMAVMVAFSTPATAGWSDWIEKGKNLISGESPARPASESPRAATQAGPLQILTVAPNGTVDDASQNTAITVTFDRPMVALQALPSEETPGPLHIEPAIKGTYRWLGTTTLVFKPEAPLAVGTQFTAKIPEGTRALDGTALEKDYRWTFETVRPQFTSSRPYHRSKFIDIKAPVVLGFNMPMSPERARGFIELRGRPTAEVELLAYDIPAYKEWDYRETFDVKIEAPTEDDLKAFYGDIRVDQLLVVRPARALKKEYTYALILKEGLPGEVGNLGLLQPAVVQYRTYNHFRVLSIPSVLHPEESLQIQFSNPVAPKELIGKTVFKPALDLPKELETMDYGNPQLHLYLKLAPNQEYTMAMSGKIKDTFGQKLDKNVQAKFSVTSYVPQFGMPPGFATVESYLKPRLPVTFINMTSLSRGLLSVTPEQAIPYLVSNMQEWQNGHKPLSGMQMEEWKLKDSLDKSSVIPWALDSSLKGGFGMMFTRLAAGQPNEKAGDYVLNIFRSSQRFLGSFVQVTNLGITAKCAPEGNLVFVSDLKTARPVADAGVELRDDAGKMLWQGRTDKNGFATTPGWGTLQLNRPNSDQFLYARNPRVWIIASKGADKAMVASNWGTSVSPWEFNLDYESRQIHPAYKVHVYTDRGLYQAGETVHIKGLYRQRKSNRWNISGIKEVSMRIKNSRGEDVLDTRLSVSDFGSFTTNFDVSPDAATGWYSIEVGDPDAPEEIDYNDTRNFIRGYGSFQVEAFRPAKFETTARLDRESYITGDKAEGTLRGWYLFGAPMKDADVEWRARLWASHFTPANHETYSFGLKRYLSSYGESQGSVLAASGQEKLDDKGERRVKFPIDAKSLAGALSLQLEATVTDQDRQTISGRTTAVVHPGDYYVGLKLSSSFIERAKPLKIQTVAVTPDGTRVPDQNVQIKIIKREWHSVRKAGIRGRVEWVTETKDADMKTLDVKTTAGEVEAAYTPEKSGFYLVRAEAKDRKGRKIQSETYFYATGQDYVAWERSDDDRIELISDRTSYKPGETAKIMVKSPFEKTLALVTLEREGIVHQFTKELKGSADVIHIPMEDRFVPNLYVSVILLQGRTRNNEFSEEGHDIGKPMFKIGYTHLSVDPGTRRLKVTASSSNPTYKPGQKARVSVHVVDHKGKPVVAECSISVADRGILDLIGYQTPDSFDTFYGPFPLSVETVESRQHVIGQRNYGEKGENRGGGGLGGLLADMELRRKFRGSAFWKADVITDANGKATVEFTLPDNITTFKTMVTAQTKDARFGAGDAQFTVKKPLMLQPSAPRFARLGDVFEAGVVVHNLTGKKGEVVITGQSTGLTLSGESQKKVLLDNGQSQEVRFSFSAAKLGRASFAFGGILGNETDGLQLEVPVILPRVTESVALYGETDSSAQEALVIPDNIHPEAGGLHIEAASTALIGLKEGVEYLQSYPHECLEQKISRVLPFVLAEDLTDAFGISGLTGEKRKKIIRDIVTAIPRFQRGDGGFGFWPDSLVSSEYLTAYTMFFLNEAREDGFQPDQAMVEKAVDYMTATLRRDDSQEWNYPYSRNALLTTKAFLIYSLALWGHKEPAYISRLNANLVQIPYFGRALLLKAIPLNGLNPSMADAVAASLINSMKIDATRAHFEEQDPDGMEWVLYSPVQTTGFVLQALLESGREFPQSAHVVRWLMDERKIGRWRSTHENIYVFYGLSEFFRRYEKDEPDFTATVKLGGTEALRHLFKGRSVEPKLRTMPWSAFNPGEHVPASIEKQGTGRLYYGLRMTYAPKGELKPREEGLSIQREITLENGDPVPAVIKAGTKLVVKLTVTTPFDRSFIAINDGLPAGFQPINTNFVTNNSGDAEALINATQDNRHWWGSFNHTEIYDERVCIYADYLTNGTHTSAYLVTATIPGTFSLPPVMVEGMYTPDVFGRSGGGTIEIK